MYGYDDALVRAGSQKADQPGNKPAKRTVDGCEFARRLMPVAISTCGSFGD
jgi:hypothetical protein